jgi:hypothetical protein
MHYEISTLSYVFETEIFRDLVSGVVPIAARSHMIHHFSFFFFWEDLETYEGATLE